MIGSIVERDLRGTGRKDEKEGKADLLLVAGTSLSIPGVKRIVKELARSLHSSSQSTGNCSNRPSTILVNSELPKGTDWHSVFDTFIAGDIQDFVQRYHELPVLDAPLPQTPKKRSSTTTPTKSKSKRSYLPTPETTVARKRVKLSTGSTEPRTPTKKSQHGQAIQPWMPSSIPIRPIGEERAPGPLRIDVPPTPDATPAKFQPSTIKTWRGGPLTPLSDAVSDQSDKNPFLV
jgi:NAD-dependent histone deacetylase SIR2